VAYLCAGRALHAVGQDKRMPSLGLVSPFCRAAMDLCAAPLVDAEPLVPPAPLEEDSLGEVLGEYDPLLLHKAELEVSEEAYAETFAFDPATGYWVLDHNAADHGRNSLSDTPVTQVGHDHPETRAHIDDDPRVMTPASDTSTGCCRAPHPSRRRRCTEHRRLSVCVLQVTMSRGPESPGISNLSCTCVAILFP
jgi:hypothetical protein